MEENEREKERKEKRRQQGRKARRKKLSDLREIQSPVKANQNANMLMFYKERNWRN